jgi:DNA-binding NarL/FixJ family response regulator
MKILLADDHPLFREGVKPVLEKLDPDAEVIEAVDFPSAFEAMRCNGEVDLVLMDLYMPGMPGIDGVIRFRAMFPDTPLVVLSASEQLEDMQKPLAVGALGYITKSSPSDIILGALRQVLAGVVYTPPGLLDNDDPSRAAASAPSKRHPALSGRHIQVLRHLARGASNRQIGEALDVTEGTIKLHVAAIFRILKVNNRTEAVLVAQKMGLDGDD